MEPKFCLLRAWYQAWSDLWGGTPATILSGCSRIPFSLLTLVIVLLSASPHGLTKSYSSISTVSSCISSDSADSLDWLVSFLLGFLCLYASWEINTQRSNCVSLTYTQFQLNSARLLAEGFKEERKRLI